MLKFLTVFAESAVRLFELGIIGKGNGLLQSSLTVMVIIDMGKPIMEIDL